MEQVDMLVVEQEIRRLVNGGATAVFVPVASKNHKVRVVGKAFYWATKAGVAIKTKWHKSSGFVKIWTV